MGVATWIGARSLIALETLERLQRFGPSWFSVSGMPKDKEGALQCNQAVPSFYAPASRQSRRVILMSTSGPVPGRTRRHKRRDLLATWVVLLTKP
jgi:hypothetical protein